MVRAGPQGGGDDDMLPDRDNPSEQQPGRRRSAFDRRDRRVRCGRTWGSARCWALPALLALAGGFVGVGVGFWIVYSRFKDL